MKAIVYQKYGPPDILQLEDVAKPTPRDNDVLIRVHAATVTASDCEIRGFKIPILFWLPIRIFMSLTKPRKNILGQGYPGKLKQ
jgi:NADPH:quinone reductase-like Zn-dependent oxidoreductase